MKRTSFAAAFILAAVGALAGPRTRPANAATTRSAAADSPQATRPATQAAERAKLLKKTGTVYLVLQYHVGYIGARPSLHLATTGYKLFVVGGNLASLTPKEAANIIDHLAREGFLAQAENVVGKDIAPPQGPAYTLTLMGAGQTKLYQVLGWDLKMLGRLEALRKVLAKDSAAGKAMDKVIKALEPQRKKWEKAATTQPGKAALRIGRSVILEGKLPYRSTEDLAFTPDGKTIVAAINNSLRVWDAASGKSLTPPRRDKSEGCFSVRFLGDGRKLATSGYKDIRIDRWPAGTPVKRLPGGSTSLLSVSADGKLLLAAGSSAVRLWRADGFKLVRSIAHPDGRGHRFDTVALSPDGGVIAAGRIAIPGWQMARGARPADFFLLRTGTGAIVRRLTGFASAMSFSGDGRRLAVIHHDGAKVWDVATGNPAWPVKTGDRPPRCLAWSPCGGILAAGAGDGSVHLLSGTTGRPLGQERMGRQPVTAVAFSRDGARLAAGDGRGLVRIWNLSVSPPTTQPAVKWGKAAGGLVCGISAFKKNIQLGVPYEIEVSIKNISKREILLLSSSHRRGESLSTRVILARGGKQYREYCTVDSKSMLVMAGAGDFARLKPSGIHKFTHRTLIARQFHRKKPEMGIVRLTEDGKYQMQIRYLPWPVRVAKGVDLGGLKPWKGVLLSAPVEVVVAKAEAKRKAS